MSTSQRFSVDYLDVLLELLREDLTFPGATVMSRNPDHLPDYLPLVVIRRVGGDSPWPEFYDIPWINVQCWCDDRYPDSDSFRAAGDLADDVRRVLWEAWKTQRVVPGKGWIGRIRESTAPQEISDPDRPFLGRYSATYELRIRSAA
jgi:hypothetical protein